MAHAYGQLDLACAQCHDDNAGKRLGGSIIPQAHPTGYPIYRLEWQALGSLQRRLRGCLTGIRAEPFPYGATKLVDLQVPWRRGRRAWHRITGANRACGRSSAAIDFAQTRYCLVMPTGRISLPMKRVQT